MRNFLKSLKKLYDLLKLRLGICADFILSYFYPPTCIGCNARIASPHKFCAFCIRKIDFIDSFCCIICGRKAFDENFECGICLIGDSKFDLARSLFVFDNFSKGIIHKMKYHDYHGIHKFFAYLLHVRYKNIINKADVILPVPMHFFKQILRKYNPANNLARSIAKISNKPFSPLALKKIKLTKTQVGLSKVQRKKNLAGSLKVNKKADVFDKVVLLVDDVMTTGSTVNLCSKLLYSSGAKKVYVLTAASL